MWSHLTCVQSWLENHWSLTQIGNRGCESCQASVGAVVINPVDMRDHGRRRTRGGDGVSLVRSWTCRPCWEQWPAPGPAAPGAAASSASPAPRARSPAWPTQAAGSHFQTGAETQILEVDKDADTITERGHCAKSKAQNQRWMQIKKKKSNVLNWAECQTTYGQT